MSKPNNVIIAATTSAVTYPLTTEDRDLLYIPRGEVWVFSATGLAGAEVVDVKLWEGTAYNQWREGGVLSQITYNDNAITIRGPAYIQLVKGVTVGAVGVYKND